MVALALLLLLGNPAAAFSPPRTVAPPAALPLLHSPDAHRGSFLRAAASDREYSNRVKITAESRAPLRQARIFFLYPATIAGASIGAYVSITRILAGMTVRTDLDPFADGRNLAIDIGVVGVAVWLFLRDLAAREALLKEIAVELGEVKPEAKADATAPTQAEDLDG
ncbi:hypothetical protein AB1Y20_006801 [Prymnesium parvum]|uniref:Uncharacterized protein n=1 Tax=Prymnesium parvum TaxID=97485 RepID=A0AB34IZD4_PRYPA